MDFVPHVVGSAVRWHRTPKSAIFDLVDDPWDTHDEDEMLEFQVATSEGAQRLIDTSRRSCGVALMKAEDFCGRARSLVDLIGVGEWLKSRKTHRFGFRNYIQQPLAYAFVLASVGRFEEGLVELQTSDGYASGDTRMREKLTELLRAATAGFAAG